jgi:hypothetical protein
MFDERPRRWRGRPKAFAKPCTVTTVRVEIDNYLWAQEQAKKDRRWTISRLVNDVLTQHRKKAEAETEQAKADRYVTEMKAAAEAKAALAALSAAPPATPEDRGHAEGLRSEEPLKGREPQA